MFQSDVELLLFLLLAALGVSLLGATFVGAAGYRQRVLKVGCLPALLAAALIVGVGIVVLLLLLDFAPNATQWLLLVGLPVTVIVAVGWLALRFETLPYPAGVGYVVGALALALALMLAALPLPLFGDGPLGGPTPTVPGPTPTAPIPLLPTPTDSPG